MAILIGKADNLVFDRRAITGPAGIDLPAVHRRAMEICPDQFVDVFIGIGDPAGKLLALQPVSQKGKGLRALVTGLEFGLGPIDRAAVESGRRTRFESVEAKPQPLQGAADSSGRPLPCPATGGLGLARVHDCLKEGTGRQDHSRCQVISATPNSYAANSLAGRRRLNQQVFDNFLAEIHIRVGLDELLDPELIGFLVGLSPRAVHRRALSQVEHPELNSGGIDCSAHQAAECIDLADEMPFGDSADRRIATHLPHRVEIGGQQHGPGA